MNTTSDINQNTQKTNVWVSYVVPEERATHMQSTTSYEQDTCCNARVRLLCLRGLGGLRGAAQLALRDRRFQAQLQVVPLLLRVGDERVALLSGGDCNTMMVSDLPQPKVHDT